jgi:phosphoadenosine phosphosulfate reductase
MQDCLQADADEQRNYHGNFLFASDPDYCCYLKKTQPIEPLLEKYDA